MSNVAPPTDQVRKRKTGKNARSRTDNDVAETSVDKDEPADDRKVKDADKETKGGRFESVKQRMRSPLMGSLKLDDIRESITSNVEVK